MKLRRYSSQLKKYSFFILMEEKVREVLNKWLDPNEQILIGLSGGADSVALTHIVNDAGYAIELIHINFHLRDEESDRDEAFVRDLHKKYFGKHNLQVIDVDTLAYAKERGISIEMAARDLRYSLFREIADRKGIKWILVGHHADDQIETALLNLSRGTGGTGMAGMEITNKQNIFRPMLGIWHHEIISYMKHYGYKFCTDSTNIDTKYKRNLIRHKVIPLMEKLNPSFKESMLRSMENFREEKQVLDFFTDDYFDSIFDAPSATIDLRKQELHPQGKPLLARKLRSMNFSDTQVHNILTYYQNKKCTSYSNIQKDINLQIYRGIGFFYNNDLPKPSPLTKLTAGMHELDGIGTLVIGGFEGDLRISHAMIEGGGSNISFRTATKEDYFQPYGMRKGKKKLFRYLGEKGIPECYRELWPVLCLDDHVIAVLPFEISDNAKLSSGERGINIAFYPSKNTFGEIVKLFSK